VLDNELGRGIGILIANTSAIATQGVRNMRSSKGQPVYGQAHCRPVKQAVSADKGMILRAILAN
jgi:hypothetical protein